MEIHCKQFSELSLEEYHRIMLLRIAIFVVEQHCPYQEIDEIDVYATHFWLAEAGEILGYARIYEIPVGLHIGRVLVPLAARQQKLGTHLLSEVLSWIATKYPKQVIQIEAQAHLRHFYGSFGFEAISKEYLEDGIPHITMQKVPRVLPDNE